MTVTSNNSVDSKKNQKDLLLEDFRYLTESFWRNEQAGETRVNWFIGLVTAVAAGLVALSTSDRAPQDEALRVIVVASLFGLLLLGIVTLLRVLIRNEATDRYVQASDIIRQLFMDHLDRDQVLVQYYPFGRPNKSTRRKLGGLAHIVAALNCLLFAALLGVAVYPVPNANLDAAAAPGPALATAAVGFGLGVLLQYVYIARRERRWKSKLVSEEPTHSGGIVFRIRDDATQYLLVGPKDDVANEWLLPKGHINESEGHGDAALREVQEETGILARLIGLVGSTEFGTDTEKTKVKYYLMESLYESSSGESRRQGWFTPEEAVDLLTHNENKLLLRRAEKLRTGGTS
jgi:8-oxo-dGTP pyrophosphatase MutT (NUDIX family)